MKYKLFLIPVFLFLSSQNILSQDKFAVGINLLPAFSYPDESSLPAQSGSFSYMFGVQADYYFQLNLFIETGLSYQSKRALIASNVPDTRGAFIDLNGNGILDDNETLDYDKIVYNDISYSFSILSFPFTVNYRFTPINSIGLIASAGVCFNYIYKNTVLEKSDKYGEVDGVSVSKNDFTTSAVLGVAIEKSLSRDITITAGPKYFFDFYNSADHSNVRFHSLGFEVKALYQL